MTIRSLDRLGFGNEVGDALNNSFDDMDKFINHFNKNNKQKLKMEVTFIDGYKTILIGDMTREALHDLDAICANRGMALVTGHPHPYSVIINNVFDIQQISIAEGEVKGLFGMNKRVNYYHLNLNAVTEEYRKEIS